MLFRSAEFLDDLAARIIHSGDSGTDEVFSFRKRDGTIVRLTGRSVRDEIKKTCAGNGLPPDYFSAHSLRKGAITHMRAQGATEDDRRDRGNYTAGSTVMNTVSIKQPGGRSPSGQERPQAKDTTGEEVSVRAAVEPSMRDGGRPPRKGVGEGGPDPGS